jgi:anti-sigma factor RsiW
MACEKQMSALISEAAGTLSKTERGALERHVEGCPQCHDTLVKQRALWRALDELPAIEPSEDFDRRLYARIAEEERRPWWSAAVRAFPPFRIRSAAPAAAACIALCGALLLHAPAPVAPPEQVQPVAVGNRIDPVAVDNPIDIDVDQVERTLDDLEMLRQLTVPPPERDVAETTESQT